MKFADSSLPAAPQNDLAFLPAYLCMNISFQEEGKGKVFSDKNICICHKEMACIFFQFGGFFELTIH